MPSIVKYDVGVLFYTLSIKAKYQLVRRGARTAPAAAPMRSTARLRRSPGSGVDRVERAHLNERKGGIALIEANRGTGLLPRVSRVFAQPIPNKAPGRDA